LLALIGSAGWLESMLRSAEFKMGEGVAAIFFRARKRHRVGQRLRHNSINYTDFLCSMYSTKPAEKSSTISVARPMRELFCQRTERIAGLRELVRVSGPWETGGVRQFLLPRWKRRCGSREIFASRFLLAVELLTAYVPRILTSQLPEKHLRCLKLGKLAESKGRRSLHGILGVSCLWSTTRGKACKQTDGTLKNRTLKGPS